MGASEVCISVAFVVLQCYFLRLSVLFNAILVVNCVYVIAPVFGPAQLRVSFGVVKELTHDSRFVAFS